jgi:hypothetical protein
MVTSLSVDTIRDSFPYVTIPKQTGTPTYESINEVHQKLKANASSIQSELGGGTHGLLGLMLRPNRYLELTGQPFVFPINPGPTTVIPEGATAAVTSALIRNHNELLRIFRETTRTDQALKQQLLATFDDMYLKALKNRHTGYTSVTSLELLLHLYGTYGRITQIDLNDNDKRMKTPYDPTLPIENLYDQIETACEYADAANAPYSAEQTITTAYLLVFATGLYKEACRDWNRRPPEEKTWVNFKTDFTIAHRELREMQLMTVQSFGNQHQHQQGVAFNIEEVTNPIADTANALNALAEATSADRVAVMNLTQANSTLTLQLSEMNDIIKKMSTQMTELQKTVNKPKTYNRNSEHYCWSHGRTRNPKHTSPTCNHKKEGHKDDATLHDKKGGSEMYCN